MDNFLLIFIIIGLLGFLITAYSQLLGLRHRFKNAFSLAIFELHKRYNLIPPLTVIVQSYISRENSVTTSLNNACDRAILAAVAADTYPGDKQLFDRLIDAEAAMQNALNEFYEFTENEPNLKTDSQLIQQIDEISRTEKKISTSLQTFNEAVMIYNEHLERFPGSLITLLFRIREAQLFDVDSHILCNTTNTGN